MPHALRFTPAELAAYEKRLRGASKGKPKAESTVVRGRAPECKPAADSAVGPAVDQYEQWLYNQLVAAGVLGMKREWPWCRGRKYLGDICIPDRRVVIEIDGGAHRIKARFKADVIKSQEALLQGWTLIRVLTEQVRDGSASRIVQDILTTLMAERAPF